MKHQRLTATASKLALLALILAACSLPIRPEAAPVAASQPELLFVYSPGCPHCTAQQPIIDEFAQLYPDLPITRVEYSQLDTGQQQLIDGTRGHPVIVFHQGEDIRQLVGATAINMMEREFALFKTEQVAVPGASQVLGHSGAT
jgi:thiol-disulfide isomerase/thioredoxin